MENKEHEPLTIAEFRHRYSGKIDLDCRFITKTYYAPDESVSIFPEEKSIDCYFQLPNWQTKLIPDERRYIYKLPKNRANERSYAMIDERRMKVPVTDLEIFADPYSPQEPETKKSSLTELDVERVVIKVLKKMIGDYEKNRS